VNPSYVAARDLIVHRVLFQLQTLVSEEVVREVARNFERLQRLEQHDIAWKGEHADWIARGIAVRLTAGLAAAGKHEVELSLNVPDGRWQTLRAAILPRFWLRRFPLKERTVRRVATTYQAVCPHMAVEHPQKHVAFLAESAAMPWDPDQSMRSEDIRPPAAKRGGRHL